MSSLILYWLIPKDRSSRVRWLLRELNIDFSERQLNGSTGEHRKGDYLDVNPFGKVPAITTDNLQLSESGAILLYLLETFDTKHRFSPGRDADRWPEFLQWFFWALTTFDSAVFAFTSIQGQEERSNVERFLVPLDRLLAANDYLMGDRFSAADVVCAYNLGVLSGRYNLKAYSSIHNYLSRLLDRPAASGFAAAIGWQ